MRNLIILISVVLLSACANLQSINRTTDLPGIGSGKAIHLDAQQRVVVVNKKDQFCAEPSPDALAAYAASLGLGVSAPTQGAASFANALQSSAGNIGLRTQSITLMRDTLYRTCEAYANGAINEVQTNISLYRSQDLTAVILAVEQLTGAVIGPQVVLTSTASSASAGTIAADAKAVQEALENKATKEVELQTAKSDLAKIDIEVKDANTARDDAKKLQSSAPTPVHEQALIDREAELKAKTDAQEAMRTLVAAREQVVISAAATVTQLQALKNVSTNATASTGGAGVGIAASQRTFSDASVAAVSTAVQSMVSSVLNKSYVTETCLLYLARTPPPGGIAGTKEALEKSTFENINSACLAFLTKAAIQQMIP